MKRRIFLTLVWLIVLAPSGARADVEIAVDVANPPFMFGRDGVAAGLYPAIIAAACKQMGETCAIKAKPWARALVEIDNGLAGVGGIYKTADRLKKYDYSAAVFVERLIVYSGKEHPIEFRALADLKGKTVGVIRGWSYGDDFDELRKTGTVAIDSVLSDAQNFGKLNYGRLDAVLAIAEAGDALLKSGRYPNVVASATPLAANPTHLAFNKTSGKAAWLARFDQAVDELRRSGRLSQLVAAELGGK